MRKALASAVFEVSAFFHVLPREIEGENFGWLLDQLDLVARYQWRQTVLAVSVSEAAFGRVIARAFGQNVPDLPSYDLKPTGSSVMKKDNVPEWQRLFEAANKRQKDHA